MNELWEVSKAAVRVLGSISSLVLFFIGLWCGVKGQYAEGTYDLVLATSVWIFSTRDGQQYEQTVEVIDKEAEARS